ncbi:hypothetical protein [Halomonas heilongjiangensis]|uniref:hypothetical protein n=1 Tax=Halomonas heilongjiangensis TaxID=1387883 RepID=UPI0011AF8FA8|nr:hypothetical protein [Halomonas heilongjiangensis]
MIEGRLRLACSLPAHDDGLDSEMRTHAQEPGGIPNECSDQSKQGGDVGEHAATFCFSVAEGAFLFLPRAVASTASAF